MNLRTAAAAAPYSIALRATHYLLMAFVIALAITGFTIYFKQELGLARLKVTLIYTHAFIAYGFLVVLALRAAVAFASPAQASLTRSLPRPRDLACLPGEIKDNLLGRRRPRFAGRSPLSRALTGGLYSAFLIMAITGLVRTGTDLFHPPLGPFVAAFIAAPGVPPQSLKPFDRSGTNPVRYAQVATAKSVPGTIHIYVGVMIVTLALTHAAGAILFEWQSRAGSGYGLARAMLLGPRREKRARSQ
ncbi:MAG: cytochrome b/b6 domain-containing protein [Beijerinckiaceae bacterium]|nr:cytochrome b/b6 domain-containing protein [Beijerinckiaceae bacterium]